MAQSSWQGWRGRGKGSGSRTQDRWRDDRSVAATAPDNQSGSADRWQSANWQQAADENFDWTRDGWRDDRAGASATADQWQSDEWIQGVDPNLDTTHPYLDEDWKPSSWRDNSPVAATAAGSASGSAVPGPWDQWRPSENYHMMVPKSKAKKKRVTNQDAANKNIGRAANRRLIIAVAACRNFKRFDYQEWLK